MGSQGATDLAGFHPAWTEGDFILAFLNSRCTTDDHVCILRALSWSRRRETEQFLALVLAARGALPDEVRHEAACAIDTSRLTVSRRAVIEVALNPLEQEDLRHLCLSDLSWYREGRKVAHAILSRDDDTELIRGAAAELLGDLHHLTGSDRRILRQLLRDPSAEVRFWAVHALGEAGDPSDLCALENLLDDKGSIRSYKRTVATEAKGAIDHIRQRACERL